MTANTVVRKTEPLTEEQFGATFRQMLNRLIRRHGEAQVALWLGVSVRHLGTNVLRGSSLPTADKIWNLLAHDHSAHDEMDREFGQRNVPVDALCSSDPISAKMAALLTRAIEAESPDSPGGTAVILHEILSMDEGILREVHRRLGGWIDQLDETRKPASFRPRAA